LSRTLHDTERIRGVDMNDSDHRVSASKNAEQKAIN